MAKATKELKRKTKKVRYEPRTVDITSDYHMQSLSVKERKEHCKLLIAGGVVNNVLMRYPVSFIAKLWAGIEASTNCCDKPRIKRSKERDTMVCANCKNSVK